MAAYSAALDYPRWLIRDYEDSDRSGRGHEMTCRHPIERKASRCVHCTHNRDLIRNENRANSIDRVAERVPKWGHACLISA